MGAMYGAGGSAWTAQTEEARRLDQYLLGLDGASNAWWRSALQLSALRFSKRDVATSFRRLAKAAHPDIGGSEEKMKRLVMARDIALRHAVD